MKDLYANPRHPYTLGLLGSLPRLDEIREAKLKSDRRPAARPDRCCRRAVPLRPAVPYAIDKCQAGEPAAGARWAR